MKYFAIPTYITLSLTFGLAQTGAEIYLTPDFQPDPMTFSYISGGPINAEEDYGGDCKGYIASEPDHVLTLENDFNYLRIFVSSSADTTMIVASASDDQVICNDDMVSGNQNPQVATSFGAGVYHIFVGSFDQDGLANYSINFSKNSP